MPIGEIAGEIFGGVLRVIGRLFAEAVFEVCVKGLGYFVCKQFSRSVNPDGFLVFMVGLAVWLFIFILAYFGYECISVQSEINRCLDSGGSYNYKINQCTPPNA